MLRRTSFLFILALALPAPATQPQRPESPWEGHLQPSLPAQERPVSRDMPADLGPFSWLREYEQICAFLAAWQVSNPASANYGGMIEAEAGPLGSVIQTDNTLEAIWVWSTRRAWTGRHNHDANIAAAWTYCTRYPAWAEEGSVNDNYYRAHNCAWGLAASLAYEEATGDSSYRAYGRTCAGYIAEHPLPLGSQSLSLNAMVTGWCAGSLYDYALAVERPDWREAAVQQGLELLDFVEENPAQWLAWDEWAMSGGTMLWGLCHSVFAEAPLYGEQWLQDHVFLTPDWSDWHNVAGYDWDGSWNVAYANGLFAVAGAVGDPVSAERARSIVGALLSLDTDDDGGIRADSHDPDTEDMSWVSCYLARFGLARLVGDPPAEDAHPLRLHGLKDESVVVQGQPQELRAIVANAGLEDIAQLQVTLEVDGVIQTRFTSLAFAGLDTLDMGAWTPVAHGRHRVVLRTSCAGDERPANDELAIDLLALAPPLATGLEQEVPVPLVLSRRGRLVDVRSRHSAPVHVGLFNLLGQQVAATEWAGIEDLTRSVNLDELAPGLAKGIYILRAEQAGAVRSLRVVTTR